LLKPAKEKDWSRSDGVNLHGSVARGVGSWSRKASWAIVWALAGECQLGSWRTLDTERCLGAAERTGTKTYLSCWEVVTTPGRALEVVAVVAGTAALDEVAAATSGNCCRKLASRSSPGFCELVLEGLLADRSESTVVRLPRRRSRTS